MSAKVISTAIVAGLLVAFTAPVFAADEPTTKADCEQQGMKWDDASGKCMK